MEEAARERQQRLAALRGTAPTVSSKLEEGERRQEESEHQRSSPHGQLEDEKQQQQYPPTIPHTLEEQAKQLLEETKSQREREESRPVELSELAPRKANWDLKRDLEAKLAKLEQETDAAIKELVRHRLRDQREKEES